MYNEAFILRAIELSRRALTEQGTEPFGAVVVRDGAIVGEGINHSAAHCDPTSHGEVEAIRDACRRLKTVDLSGCELYSSCEPCAMCVAVLTIANISKLYYAANLIEAAGIMKEVPKERRHPIDSSALRDAAGKSADHSALTSSKDRADEALFVIERWAASRV